MNIPNKNKLIFRTWSYELAPGVEFKVKCHDLYYEIMDLRDHLGSCLLYLICTEGLFYTWFKFVEFFNNFNSYELGYYGKDKIFKVGKVVINNADMFYTDYYRYNALILICTHGCAKLEIEI